jgi:hypothetical protein
MGGSDLKVFIKAEGGDEWVLEKSVQLQESVREVRNQDACELQFTMLNKIVSVTEGSVLLCTDKGVGLVSVDLATMEFKRVKHDKDKYHGRASLHVPAAMASDNQSLLRLNQCSACIVLPNGL